jgi:hypothetical protein
VQAQEDGESITENLNALLLGHAFEPFWSKTNGSQWEDSSSLLAIPWQRVCITDLWSWPTLKLKLRPKVIHLYIATSYFLLARLSTVRIFFDRIRDRIHLEELRSVRIRVRIFNIRYRIRIRILKSHIYDVDIQYPIRHSWHYPYSNPNPDKNMKTNVISVISVRIWYIFIPTLSVPNYKSLWLF